MRLGKKEAQHEGKKGRREPARGEFVGKNKSKKLELCYSPWKGHSISESISCSTCKTGVINYDFLTDILIVDLNVPCKLYNMM